MKQNKLIWTFCVVAMICIVVLTYTPLITPAGQSAPFLLNLPYTLWITILLTLIVVGLTWVGGHVIPHEEGDDS